MEVAYETQAHEVVEKQEPEHQGLYKQADKAFVKVITMVNTTLYG